MKPVNDDDMPIDFEWWKSVCPFPGISGVTFKLYHKDCQYLNYPGEWAIADNAEVNEPIPGPSNRGEFRLLCKMLGISLKEGEQS